MAKHIENDVHMRDLLETERMTSKDVVDLVVVCKNMMMTFIESLMNGVFSLF